MSLSNTVVVVTVSEYLGNVSVHSNSNTVSVISWPVSLPLLSPSLLFSSLLWHFWDTFATHTVGDTFDPITENNIHFERTAQTKHSCSPGRELLNPTTLQLHEKLSCHRVTELLGSKTLMRQSIVLENCASSQRVQRWQWISYAWCVAATNKYTTN